MAATHPEATAAPVGRAPTTPPLRAGALAFAGLLFVAYPALRPYSDETTLAGAAAMGSTRWVVSHVLGVLAFVLLAAGLRQVASVRSAAVTAAGVALVLPYYGAETFGVQVIARRALATGDPSLLALVEELRMGPIAVATFGAGLVLLAVGGVLTARAVRRTGTLARLGGLLSATGLVLYAPQYLAPGALRTAHGVVLGAGLLLLALAGRRGATDR